MFAFTNRQIGSTVPLHWTAKTINSTPASRSAVNADLKPGHVVVQDVYSNDSAFKEIDVGQAVTGDLHRRAFVVTSVPPIINSIPDSSASTQRKGGSIEGCSNSPLIQAYVADGVAVGDELVPTNGQFYLSVGATSGLDTPAEIKGMKATALEANSSGAAALRWVAFNGG